MTDTPAAAATWRNVGRLADWRTFSTIAVYRYTKRASGACVPIHRTACGESRRHVPPRPANSGRLRRDIRVRVLAVRLRARLLAAEKRAALLLHDGGRVLGGVVGRGGPDRGGLRLAGRAAAPRGAAVVLGGGHHGRRRPVRRGPHRRADPAR